LLKDYPGHYLVNGPLVILRKINLNPGIAARAYGIQRSPVSKFTESARSPIAVRPAGDQSIHLLDEEPCPGRSEFNNTDIFAVSLAAIHCLGDIYYPPITDSDFHFFIAEWRRSFTTIGN